MAQTTNSRPIPPEEMIKLEAAIALNRFGYGAMPNELEKVTKIGGRSWLLQQLSLDTSNPKYNLFFNSMASNDNLLEFQRQEQGLPMQKFRNLRSIDAITTKIYPELKKRATIPVLTEHGFHERMVRFWMNLFMVETADPFLQPLLIDFETEVVRRFMNARYYDLLLAALRHPLMLITHQNASSAGRYSIIANNDDRLLNPRLGKILVERLTLGSNYEKAGQATEAMAQMLTGWSVAKNIKSNQLEFKFNADLHQPDYINLLGKSYADGGAMQAEAGIWTLVNMPETALNIAFRIAHHFISDNPNPNMIDKMALDFINHQGSIPKLFIAMINSPFAFNPNPEKLKSPADLIYSMMRNFDIPDIYANHSHQEIARYQENLGTTILQELAQLGQPGIYGNLGGTSLAKGWSDKGDDWLMPDYLSARIDWVQASAYQRGQFFNGTILANYLQRIFGPLLNMEIYDSIYRRMDGLTSLKLFLSSPSFQRR